jgi:hypothetical protein
MKHVFGIFSVLTILGLFSCSTTDSSSNDSEDELIINSASALFDKGDVLVEITSDSALALLKFSPLDSASKFALDDKIIGEDNADNSTKFSATLKTETSVKICNQVFQMQIRGFSVSQNTEIEKKKEAKSIVDDDFYPKAAFLDTVNINYNDGYVCDDMGEPKKLIQFSDTITIGAQKAKVGSSVDVDDGMRVYTADEADQNSAKIDFILGAKESGGLFVFSPKAGADEKDDNFLSKDWALKNDTEFAFLDEEVSKIYAQKDLDSAWERSKPVSEKMIPSTGTTFLIKSSEGRIFVVQVISSNTENGAKGATILAYGSIGDKVDVEVPAE